jgi:hypothetical protein
MLHTCFPHPCLAQSSLARIEKPCVHFKTEAVGIKIETMDASLRSMTAFKRRKEEKRRKTVAKEILDGVFSGAVARLSEAKEKNGGRLPQGKMTEVIQGLRDIGVHTTRDVLNKLLQKYVKPVISVNEETRAPLSVLNLNAEQSKISSLHGVNGAESPLQTTSVKKGGRPKGTTKANANKENERNAKCKVEIAEAYQEKINEMKAAGKQQVSKGYLIDLICRKKKERGLPNDYYISDQTIKSRI